MLTEKRDLFPKEKETITESVERLRTGEHWALIAWDPDGEVREIASPQGIAQKDLVRVAMYLLEPVRDRLTQEYKRDRLRLVLTHPMDKLLHFKNELEELIHARLDDVSLEEMREFFGDEGLASITHKVRC